MKVKDLLIILLIFTFVSSFAMVVYLFHSREDAREIEKLQNSYKKVDEKSEIANDNFKNIDIMNKIDNLKKEFNNTDIIGTINIYGTNINTPIVQGNDNSFYLSHSIDKSENILGSVYLDYHNTLSDKVLIFYGHNSRSLKPLFHDLEKFLDEAFFQENNKINLVTENGDNIYEIFSVMVVPKNDTIHAITLFESNDEYLEHLKYLKASSKFYTDTYLTSDDEIIVLQTCYYNPENTFLVVVAKKI